MYSLTQTGNLVSLISILLGVTSAEANGFMTVVFAIAALIGNVISWYGRYRKGDIKLSGFRKA